ncbi:MAG: hypothetical protein KZQ58_05055 [gamma proteobacterium symbiont of Bathyaustriella thionipta]|nr:hypothetical protein [gamma proteobacterium symbiont of Bathyaustriella thionipta]
MIKQLLLVLSLLLSNSLWAAGLTTESASKWMDSMQALEKWGDTHPQETKLIQDNMHPPAATQNGLPPMPSFDRAASAAKAAGVAANIESVIKPFGFSNIDSWAATGDTVMKAFMTLRFKQHDMNAQLQQQLKMIEADPNMDAAQKKQIIQSMQGMAQSFQQNANAPAADVEAVRPLLSRFEKLGS